MFEETINAQELIKVMKAMMNAELSGPEWRQIQLGLWRETKTIETTTGNIVLPVRLNLIDTLINNLSVYFKKQSPQFNADEFRKEIVQ